MPTPTGEPRGDEQSHPESAHPLTDRAEGGSSGDGRPFTGRPRTGRPEFGEYATPQEQAAAIARSLPPAERGAATSAEKPGETGSPDAAAPPIRPPDARRWSAGTSASPASPGTGPVNRFVTILLLAIGLFYLLEGLPAYLAFGEALQSVFTQWGIGEYTPTPSTQSIGIAILVVQAVLWAVTAVLAVVRLRRRRSSWWIALLGGVASFLVTATLFAVVLVSDPAFTTYLTSV